jgi:spore cortex formation protein SpoVR/YcgB (stage V sporulation)
MKKPLVVSGQDWTFDLLEEILIHIERIAFEKYGLDTYTNKIETIKSEQMIDAYSANGLPIFYPHWSFGEQFVKHLEHYRRGKMGLAYEIVINSNPCISYLMEENTMLMQTLVLAHAAFGHNSFFKTNYLFKKWTDAETIIDYLTYAKKFIRHCEVEYGYEQVEATLDAAHAIQMHGIYKYKRPLLPTAAEEEKMREDRDAYIQSQVNELWNTIPKAKSGDDGKNEEETFPEHPEENLVTFIGENAARMEDWQRQILRIVSYISQYFYPQMQTKVANEATACFWHFTIMNDLYEEGILSEDAMIEFTKSHTEVLFQPDYDHKYYNGINPYALGFSILRDVKRICLDPTEEDREWFAGQEWVGSGDWVSQIKYISAEFKDESLIKQYLSPKVIRDLKLFDIFDDEKDAALEVAAIHDDSGYKQVRNSLSKLYNIGYHIPDIQAVRVDRWGDRSLELRHYMTNEIPLESQNAVETLRHIGYLWGYDVILLSKDSEDNTKMKMVYSHKDDDISIEVYN